MSVSCPEADIVPENYRTTGKTLHNHEVPDRQQNSGGAVYEAKNLAMDIHKYLNDHLDQHITIESLSRQFCVNPTTIKTVFRETFGNSVAAHTREHRMEKAAGLLKESSLSLAEIATAVGYRNQSKFTQAFKESYGVLPKDYRAGSRHN